MDRHYNSGHNYASPIGYGWSHNFDRHLTPNYVTIAPTKIIATRQHGRSYEFIKSGSVWSADGDVIDRLEASGADWRYTNSDGEVEIYNATGTLQSITDLAGNTQNLSYDTQGRLDRVDTNTGEYLTVAYDTNNRIATLTDHTGRIWGYRYDAIGNLEYVDNPDGTSKRYHYENTSYPHALTGITDERGIRYATYGYDSQGRANLSTHAGNAQRVDIVYNSDGTRTVTNSRNQPSTYSTAVQLGVALVTDISGPGCSTCGSGNTSYTYDPANNNLLSKTENGVTTQYGNYDSKGQYGYKIEAVGTAQQRRTDYSYDPRFYNKITTLTEPSVYAGSSKVTTYTYDDWGNRLTETISGYTPTGTAVSRITSYQYNGPLHQLSQIDGPRTDVADITSYSYYADDAGQGSNRARLQRVTDANGVALRDNIQYSATGKVLSESRPNGLTLSYSYYPGNDRLQTLTESTGSGNRVTRWTYLATGEVESITQADGSADATTLTFGYDDARRLVRITDGLGNYIAYQLDTEGNREAERTYDLNGVLKKQLAQTFDLYNRLDTSTQANETSNPNYAPDGTLDTSTDGRNVVTDYSYDALKRLTQVVQDQSGADPTTANANTAYGYDSADRLTSVTDPVSGNTSYAYDDLGNLLTQTSPDTGTSSFTYDSAGNLTTKLDAKSQLFSYSYDTLNRLTSLDAPGTANDISYSYDSCTNGVGRLCSLTKNSGSVDYSYDGFGAVTSHQDVGYGYDSAGRVKTLTYPSGAVVSYSYDAGGQVSRVQLTHNGVTQDLASNISHAPFGPLVNLSYGNGHALSQGFDDAYRMQSQSVPGVLQFNYAQYDANGNLQQRQDNLTAQTDSFGYDALNRLGTANGGFGARGYDYDKNGNRMQLTRDGSVTPYAYSANSNRLTSINGGQVSHDNNGNLATQGGWYYTYTQTNRLRQAYLNWQLKATYTYNGLGQRQRKDVGGKWTDFRYGLDGQLLVESSGSASREYIYLDGQPLAVLDHSIATTGLGLSQTTTPALKGGTVGVAWNGIASPTATDWIAVYAVGAADGNYLDWVYTNGSATGTATLSLNDARLVPGQSYELRLYANDGYNRLATSAPFVLNPSGPTVIATTPAAVAGGSLGIAWSDIASPTSTDWIAIYAPGSADGNYLDWVYTNGSAAGTGTLTLNHPTLTAGSPYEVRLYANDGYTRLATGGTFVLSAASAGQTSTLSYIHTDHLGTPVRLTDASGNLVWSAVYDPFGKATVAPSSTVTMNVRFPGQYFDAETGLHYNYFRAYDPGTGRYLESDPIGLGGGLNTYGYVGGNPITRYDYYGLIEGNVGLCSGGSLAFFVGFSGGVCVYTGTDGRVCTYAYVCSRIGVGPYAGIGTSVSGAISGGTNKLGGFSAGLGGDIGLGASTSAQGTIGPGVASGARGGPGLGAGFNVGLDFCWLELISCDDGQCN